MFGATRKGTYIKLKYLNNYDEAEVIEGKIIGINQRQDLLTLKHESGKKYYFYDYEVIDFIEINKSVQSKIQHPIALSN